MARIRIKKFDKARILFTEVLPYEVPIPITNKGLYEYEKRKNSERVPSFVSEILELQHQHGKKSFLPFNYSCLLYTSDAADD